MCVPACTQKIAADVSRRSFLRRAAGLAAVTALAGCAPFPPRRRLAPRPPPA